MIKISGLSNSLWISDPIQIGPFFEKFTDSLSPGVKALQKCGEDNYDLETMSSVMGTSQTKDQFHELISYCAEDKLDVPDEPSSLKVRLVTTRHSLFSRLRIPSAEVCDLATLKYLRLERKEKDSARGLKYSKTLFVNNEPGDKKDLTVKKDIVVSIRVHDTIFPEEIVIPPVKPLSQEIMVLGSQTLANLRDVIMCSSDNSTTHQETEKLIHESEERRRCMRRAKDEFKSGFFFIEDVFYNDWRNPSNIDYSEVIRSWADRKGIGPLDVGDMSDMKIKDLTVRFGYPYVYQHQGNCEHLIVFSDASLLHESDVCEANRYPLFKAVGCKKPQECMICYYYFAEWITFGNERVPVDPYYFCDECMKSYNFINQKKIGDFKMYEYQPFLPIPKHDDNT